MSQVKTLLTDRMFVESPRWHNDRFWFSDWGAQEVITTDVIGNHKVIVSDVKSFPFCIGFLPDGRTLLVSNKQVLRIESDGSFVPHADLTNLSSYNWNDIVVDHRGNIFVNNSELGFQGGLGIVAVIRPDGSVGKAASDLMFPNGMAVSIDGSTLVIAESFAKRLTAFTIGSNGDLSNRRVWANLEGGPDGICFDSENAIWAASGKSCVRVREGGEILQKIDLDMFCTACTLGGIDGKTLLMTMVDWQGDATMAHIGEMSRAIASGQKPRWQGGRTGRIYITNVSVPSVH